MLRVCVVAAAAVVLVGLTFRPVTFLKTIGVALLQRQQGNFLLRGLTALYVVQPNLFYHQKIMRRRDMQSN